jgi:hypothetical protein
VIGDKADESWLEWGGILLADLAKRVADEKVRLEQERLDEDRRIEETRLEDERRVAEEERKRLEQEELDDVLRRVLEGGDVDFEDNEPVSTESQTVGTGTSEGTGTADKADEMEVPTVVEVAHVSGLSEVTESVRRRPKARPLRKTKATAFLAEMPGEKVSFSSSLFISLTTSLS